MEIQYYRRKYPGRGVHRGYGGPSIPRNQLVQYFTSAEIVRKLEGIPSDIAEQLGEWKDDIVGLVEETKEAVTGIVEVKDLEEAQQEPLEETLTEEETIVEEETAAIQVQPEYGFFMDGQINEISHGFYEKQELSYDKFQYEFVLTSSTITGS